MEAAGQFIALAVMALDRVMVPVSGRRREESPTRIWSEPATAIQLFDGWWAGGLGWPQGSRGGGVAG